MHVRGHLGMVKTLESFAGAAKVVNDLTGNGAPQKEVESRQAVIPTTSSLSYFEGFGVFLLRLAIWREPARISITTLTVPRNILALSFPHNWVVRESLLTGTR